mgnify:CR=1 FL=1
MKMNKEFILKNLMGIICAVIILALFLPFMSVKAEVSVGGFGGGSADQSMNGFSLVTDGGFFGFAFILCLVAVAASCYIPQLKPFRKIISAIGSVHSARFGGIGSKCGGRRSDRRHGSIRKGRA